MSEKVVEGMIDDVLDALGWFFVVTDDGQRNYYRVRDVDGGLKWAQENTGKRVRLTFRADIIETPPVSVA